MELFNPHSNEWLLHKFDYYKKLRSLDQAYYSESYGLYVITRHADVVSALADAGTFSSAKGNLIVENPRRFGNTLGASDNPTHDIYKNIVKNAYSKSNLERVATLYRQAIKAYISGKTIINLSDVADQTTAWAIAEILNLPYDKEKIKDLIVGIQRHAAQCVRDNVDQTSYNSLMSIIIGCLKSKTPSTGPGIYHEFLYNNPEKLKVVSLFTGPTISGASSLTGAVQFLLLDIYRQQQLSKILNDRSLIPNAVNESLRFNASTGRFSRTVAKPVTLHGVNLKVGDRVALSLESANRDETVFPDPDNFDLSRGNLGNVAFGHGLHACIALALSKGLMQVFLDEFLNVVGNYKVLTDDNDLKYVMTQSGNDDMISNILIEKV